MAKKKTDLKNLSVDELNSKTKELTGQLFKLKMQFVTGQLANTSALKVVRQEIARAKTFLTQKLNVQQ